MAKYMVIFLVVITFITLTAAGYADVTFHPGYAGHGIAVSHRYDRRYYPYYGLASYAGLRYSGYYGRPYGYHGGYYGAPYGGYHGW